jgi:tRNA A37 threonylcarbamoyladenosine biosynthesis protein TsaE
MLAGKCYCCGKGGHQSPECHLKDKIPKEDWAMAHVHFYQAKEMKNWILLDNSSSVDLFCNPNLATNICTVEWSFLNHQILWLIT